MKKSEVRDAVEAILGKYPNTSNKLKAELLNLFTVQRTGTQNPPVFNDDGIIIEAWCRVHGRYEPADDMILHDEGRKSKGICKAGSREWSKRNNAIKSTEKEATEKLIAGDTDGAIAAAQSAKTMKERLNDVSTYDYDADWSDYDAANKVEVSTPEQ